MKYNPRHTTVLVKRITKDAEDTKVGDIYIPREKKESIFVRLLVISCGPEVTDLKKGDVVLAEDMFQQIDLLDKGTGLIQEKFIWVVERNDDGIQSN
jgi:hypothetical protein